MMCASFAREAAIPGLRGTPSGVRYTRLQPGDCSCSIAANTGSGFSTIPAPPPNGRSSAVRCLSVVHLRRSWTATESRPLSRPFPRMLSARKPSSIPGKSVSTSMRGMLPPAFLWRGASAGGRRGGWCLGGLGLDRSRGRARQAAAEPLDDGVQRVGGLCALSDPVVHAVELDVDLLVPRARVVGAQRLHGVAIAARARLRDHDAVVGLVRGADA